MTRVTSSVVCLDYEIVRRVRNAAIDAGVQARYKWGAADLGRKPLTTLWQRLVSRLRRNLGVHLCVVMTRPRGAAAETPGACPPLEYRAMSEAEMLAFSSDSELELSGAQVRKAYGRGDVCVGALEAGRLVGYVWIAFSSTPHTNDVWVDFDPRGRYSYKSFVRPAYRGRRIVQALYVIADDLYLHRGRSFVVYFIDADNRPSLAAARHAGSRVAGLAGYFQALGMFYALCSPGAKRCGFRFYRPAPARLALRFLRSSA
jgi:ribosomal protein S18 acetylase RimI-like enzyme